jgi:hypothetical protein
MLYANSARSKLASGPSNQRLAKSLKKYSYSETGH